MARATSERAPKRRAGSADFAIVRADSTRRRSSKHESSPPSRGWSAVSSRSFTRPPPSWKPFRFEEAATEAARAKDLAAGCRQVFYEARAEWILRTTAYRLGQAREADEELIAASAEIGVLELEGLIDFTEACVAWRAGDPARAAELANSARNIWKRLGMQWAELLATSLAGAADPRLDLDVEAMAARAAECQIPGIGVQILALVAPRWPAEISCPVALAIKLAEQVPREHWHRCMDVLSVRESLDLIGKAEIL